MTTPLPDFLASECEMREADALFHVLPAPMEQSVSYGAGTTHGPRAILEASQQLEAWDGLSMPLSLGIHTKMPVLCDGSAQEIVQRIENACTGILSSGKIPVVLGGEHTVSLGALRAVVKQYGRIGVVQIDAHADLRDQFEGSKYSHACVMRRAVEELHTPLFQCGVRALSQEEELFRQSQPTISHLDARDLAFSGISPQVLPPDFPETIYLTVDVDGLDPSVIRATGTPVPGGLSWYQCLTVLGQAMKGRHVVGFDVVELAPDQTDHASSFAAALLVYSIMGMIQRNRSTM